MTAQPLNTRSALIAYAAAAVAFLALDAVWLTLMADRLYRPALGHLLMPDGFKLLPAVLFYVLYIGGVVFFAVAPAVAASRRGWPGAFGRGALFGLIAYATYDLTNQATLRDWPWAVTLADLCWGSLVTALAAAAACRVLQFRTGG